MATCEINNKARSVADIRLNEQTTILSSQLHGLSCPNCSSQNYFKKGKEKGNQRYCCSRCGKHFRSTTGKTIHHLHLKPKIQEYLNCMSKGLSLRKSAQICNISLRTAFRWRHRFLQSMQTSPFPSLCEQKILSAFTLPFSTKSHSVGQKRKEKITSILFVDIIGRTNIHVLGEYGKSAIQIAEQTTDQTLSLKSKSTPKLFKTKSKRFLTNKEESEIKLVHFEMQTWLNRFRGVASRYLENYWHWFMFSREIKQTVCEQRLYMYKCL